MAELEALLQRLSDVNEAMGSAVRGAGLARMHTVARHRDILDELTHEFNRTRALVKVSVGCVRVSPRYLPPSSNLKIGTIPISPGVWLLVRYRRIGREAMTAVPCVGRRASPLLVRAWSCVNRQYTCL